MSYTAKTPKINKWPPSAACPGLLSSPPSVQQSAGEWECLPGRSLEYYYRLGGDLRPLLNDEISKKEPNGDFENRMTQIWFIFKQVFENTIHFQTHFEKIPLPRAAPWGGIFFKQMFANGPYFKTSF